MSDDLLPESRAKDDKGIVRGNYSKFGSINWVPVFCYNCGKPHGYVPEETCTFTCWLCDPCAEKWGEQFGLLMAPDEAFWKKVEMIMLEKYGRILSPEEIQKLVADGSGSFPKLIRQGA